MWNEDQMSSFSSQLRVSQIIGLASFIHVSRKHKAKANNLNTFNISFQDNLSFSFVQLPDIPYCDALRLKAKKAAS